MTTKTRPVIPFISSITEQEQLKWLELLNEALPEEKIVAAKEVSLTQRLDCEIAIVANPEPKEVLGFQNLKWIHSLWAGVERLVEALHQEPFKIVRLVDPHLAKTMAEAALSWTLYIHRDMPDYAFQQERKIWYQRPVYLAESRKVGILGLGELGLSCAQKLLQNDFNVMGWSRSPKQIPGIDTYSGNTGLNEMLAQCDILICLLPLTAHTKELLNAEFLTQLPKGASIINFARGPIIQTNDLLEKLDEGHLKHAVLDVFDEEPLGPNSPIWSHPKITVLPHISAPTNVESAVEIVAGNILNYRRSGALPVTVDGKRGY